MTAGQYILQGFLPDDMKGMATSELDKKGLSRLLTKLAQDHPDAYAKFLDDVSPVIRRVSTTYGGPTALSAKDFRVPPELAKAKMALRKAADRIVQSDLPVDKKRERITSLMVSARPELEKLAIESLAKNNNTFALSTLKGFKGNPAQLLQLYVGDLLVADGEGNPIPVPGLHGYNEGLTPEERWAESYSSRSGYSSVQFMTAKTGYLGRQKSGISGDVRITGSDCGASDVGLPMDLSDPDALGRITSEARKDVPAGTVVTQALQDSMGGEQLALRSAVTCRQPFGICQKCAGKQANGRFPSMGSFIGVESARGVAEPMVQKLGLSAKHTGSLVGVNDDYDTGFEAVDSFLQSSENSDRKSILSPLSGKVASVEALPSGGHLVMVEGTKVEVPPHRAVTAKPGDMVEAGDELTDGVASPSEVAKHKGIGEGRRYIVDAYARLLKANGMQPLRRNLEIFSRGYIDHVRVNAPDGVAGYDPGQRVQYSELASKWEPREGHAERAPRAAIGMYLERPVAHLTIGTRITPRLASMLATSGAEKIDVHREPPPFEVDVLGAARRLSAHPDWKARMGGSRLSDAVQNMAALGSDSPHGRTGASWMMNPSGHRKLEEM